jgi:hypothetical protein
MANAGGAHAHAYIVSAAVRHGSVCVYDGLTGYGKTNGTHGEVG